MKRVWITALVLILLFVGCQSSRPNLSKQTLEITALYGTDFSLLDYAVEDEVIELVWASVTEEGNFIRINLPSDSHEYQPTWDNSEGCIQAVIPGQGFLDVGIVALDSYSGAPAKLTIKPVVQGKTISIPPTSVANEVDYMVAYQLDAGTVSPDSVRLEWTELNTGDYDFNGEVNIADITPIAINFQSSYSTESTIKREQTVYWVDGDRNGEVNLADITRIAVNYMSTVDGYNIYSGLGNPIKVSRDKAQFRKTGGFNLPPLYSVLLDGLATDPWQVAPLDNDNEIGALSTKPPFVIEEFNAVGSLVISGLDLYQFDSEISGSLDSGYSLMRLLDPGIDIDSAEIGDIIEGEDGLFAIQNIPLDQELALEITFAPVLNLLTGLPFSEDPVDNQALSIANPVVVRSLFTIPTGIPSYFLQPRIHLSPNPLNGYDIDMTVFTSWDTGKVQQNVRLNYFNYRVAAKPITSADFQYSPLLRDTDRDLISDAKAQEIADLNEYPTGNTETITYRGRITQYHEADGTMVMGDPWIIDNSKPGGGEPAPDEAIEFNFTEYTPFDDEVSPMHFEPSGVAGNEVVITCNILSEEGTLLTKWWATSITRTDLLP